MLWIKALHIIFVTSWMAGLFYLPRIFINLAMTQQPDEIARLLLMGRKLMRFTTLLAVPAIGFGLWLYLDYGIGKGAGWFHAKLALVICMIGYHHGCSVMMRKFERGLNKRSHVWYRVFNEALVVLFSIVVILVVVKPF